MAACLVEHLFVKLVSGAEFVCLFRRRVYSVVERKKVVHLSVPYFLRTEFCVEAIKHSITAKNNKIMSISIYFDVVDLRITYNYIGIALELFQFGLCITKCS
jgi:hypothetical protein